MQPQFATTIKESGRVPPVPSVRLLHNTTSWAIREWPVHYHDIHHCRRCEVSSNSATVKTTKFTGPYKSRMRQYVIKIAHRGQTIGP
jgi:hypothetical protein